VFFIAGTDGVVLFNIWTPSDGKSMAQPAYLLGVLSFRTHKKLKESGPMVVHTWTAPRPVETRG
jgi:hypothetical protein